MEERLKVYVRGDNDRGKEVIETLPEALFNFSMSLDWLHLGVTDYHDYMRSLDLISNIAKQFTHIDFWEVVRLKMLYNKTRPRYNGKKY